MPLRRSRRAGGFWLGFVWGLAACGSRPGPPETGVGGDGAVFDAADERGAGDAGSDGRAGDAGGLDSGADAADAGVIDAAGEAGGDAAEADAGEDAPDDVADDVADADTFADADAEDVVPIFDAAGSDVHLPTSCEQDAAAMPLCSSDAECAAGQERCLPTGCAAGERRCQRAGRPCVDDTDCLPGAQACLAGTCVATGADCGDTRACPLGFDCEGPAGARTCVDRRRPCGTLDNLCPYNALCYQTTGSGAFCVAVATRCAHDGACLPGTRCVDLDGDGLSECAPSGRCSAATCGDAGAQNCEILPEEFVPVCGARGLCSDAAPCAAGYNCVDAWGTGVGECRPDADACHAHADCPAGELCFSTDEEGQDGGGASGCR